MKHKIRKYLTIRMKSRETSRHSGTLKYVRMVFLICFIAGIVSANLVGEKHLGSFGIWNSYFIEKFKYADIRADELFFYILEERLPMIFLLFTLAATSWGVAAGVVFVGWQGFAGGFLTASSVVTYGLKGMLLIGTALFPHYLIYIPVYIAYLYLSAFFRQRMGAMHQGSEALRVKEYLRFIVLCLLILIVFVTGVFLESYVNPCLLKKVLKFF